MATTTEPFGPGPATSGWSAVGRATMRVLRAVRWYSRALIGADAYERYLAHQARTNPGAPVLGEREFWRKHMDEQEVRPGQRCC